VILSSETRIVYTCAAALDNYSAAFENMPLLSRGWTLQERVLPTRTVHFTSTKVFWECHTITACETNPHFYSITREDTQKGCHEKEKVTRSAWERIVSQYSRMSLTMLKDRPIAIAGIAKEIHDQTGTEYFAGIWWDTLFHDLLWAVESPAQVRPAYRAPSWTWLSIEGSIYFPDPYIDLSPSRILCEVIDIKTTPINSFGEVNWGVLKLKSSSMLKVFERRQEPRDYHLIPFSEDFLDGHCKGSPTEQIYPFRFSPDCSDWDVQGQESGRAVYLFPILIGLGLIKGLVLVRPTNEKNGYYMRIGLFEQDCDDEDEVEPADHNKFYYPQMAPFFWNDPNQNWGPKVTSEDFISMEWIGGREWGTIEIH